MSRSQQLKAEIDDYYSLYTIIVTYIQVMNSTIPAHFRSLRHDNNNPAGSIPKPSFLIIATTATSSIDDDVI